MHRAAVLCCLLLLSACAAAADDISPRVCPILERVSREGNGKAAIAVQVNLISEVAAAYEFKPEPLQAILANVDAATLKACPEARAAVLKLVGMETLEQAMR